MDVFHDQKFLLQRPTGERCTKSFFEIMTGPDEPLSFAYPTAYMNVAALELCAALAQAALEPHTHTELAEHIRTPMSEKELETRIASYLDDFSIDGPMRFMQGIAPSDTAQPSPESLTDALLTVRKGGSAFLNRPHERWTVRMDQIPLLLFSRATFTEKQGGRGYLAGTSKDLEVRTCLLDSLSLRRSIWLNVLCRAEQQHHPLAGDPDAFDTWLWKTLPDERKLPQHKVTLRAGLFWIVARHSITLAALDEPTVCMVTGAPIPAGERAGVAIDKSSIGIGFGEDRNDDEQGGSPSFFYHPNAPYEMVEPKDGRRAYPRHFTVDEQARLVEIMGGLFFSDSAGRVHAADVLKQLQRMANLLPEYSGGANHRLRLSCFGFHMLTAQKTIHGGYEAQTFTYPLVGTGDPDPQDAQEEAFSLLVSSARNAVEIMDILAYAVRICTLTRVDVTTDSQPGKISRLKFEPKAKERLSVYDAYMRDATVEYWSRLGVELQTLLQSINRHGSTHEELAAHREDINARWDMAAARLAHRLFTRVFNDYVTAPGYLLSAHNAKLYFNRTMGKRGYFFSNTTQIVQSTEEYHE